MYIFLGALNGKLQAYCVYEKYTYTESIKSRLVRYSRMSTQFRIRLFSNPLRKWDSTSVRVRTHSIIQSIVIATIIYPPSCGPSLILVEFFFIFFDVKCDFFSLWSLCIMYKSPNLETFFFYVGNVSRFQYFLSTGYRPLDCIIGHELYARRSKSRTGIKVEKKKSLCARYACDAVMQ